MALALTIFTIGRLSFSRAIMSCRLGVDDTTVSAHDRPLLQVANLVINVRLEQLF
jgi:hypothetical protein